MPDGIEEAISSGASTETMWNVRKSSCASDVSVIVSGTFTEKPRRESRRRLAGADQLVHRQEFAFGCDASCVNVNVEQERGRLMMKSGFLILIASSCGRSVLLSESMRRVVRSLKAVMCHHISISVRPSLALANASFRILSTFSWG